MIWKLTRFELKKAQGSRFFLIALCLLLGLNLLLLGGVREWLDLQTAVREGTLLEGVIAPEDHTFWRFMTVSRCSTTRLKEEYALLSNLTQEERTAFEAAMKEKYGENVLDDAMLIPTEEMLALPGYLSDNQSDFISILDYQLTKSWNQEYRETINGVLEAAKSFGRDALAAGDNYSIRRNLNIIRLYSVPRKEVTAPVRGWEEFLFDTPTMILVYLLVLLTTAGSFAGELDKGTWLILQTGKYGKTKTLIAKYLSGAVTAAALTVLFQAVSLGAVWFKGGLLGASQSVSALPELKLCPYPLTVWQYALVSLGCQIFTAILLSALVSTVSALSKSSILAYAVGSLLLGGFLLLSYFPVRVEFLTGPLALSRPLRYFSSYFTGSLFSFPVPWSVIQAVVWTVLGIGSMVLANRVYHRKRRAV